MEAESDFKEWKETRKGILGGGNSICKGRVAGKEMKHLWESDSCRRGRTRGTRGLDIRRGFIYGTRCKSGRGSWPGDALLNRVMLVTFTSLSSGVTESQFKITGLKRTKV